MKEVPSDEPEKSASSPSLLWLLEFNVNGLLNEQDIEDEHVKTINELAVENNSEKLQPGIIINGTTMKTRQNSRRSTKKNITTGTKIVPEASNDVCLSTKPKGRKSRQKSSDATTTITSTPYNVARFEECSSSTSTSSSTSPELNELVGHNRKKKRNNNNIMAISAPNNNISEQQMAIDEINKPKCTYTELIEKALHENPQGLTVSQIYGWIANNHTFFRLEDDRWKNSVRHNLSINPYFEKRGKCKNGAGHVWTIAESCRKDGLMANGGEGSDVDAEISKNLNHYSKSIDSFESGQFKTETERIVGGILKQYSLELNNNNSGNTSKIIGQSNNKDTEESMNANNESKTNEQILINEHEDLLITTGLNGVQESSMNNNNNNNNINNCNGEIELNHEFMPNSTELSEFHSTDYIEYASDGNYTIARHEIPLLHDTIQQQNHNMNDDGVESQQQQRIIHEDERMYEFLTSTNTSSSISGNQDCHHHHHHHPEFNEFELLTFDHHHHDPAPPTTSIDDHGNFYILTSSNSIIEEGMDIDNSSPTFYHHLDDKMTDVHEHDIEMLNDTRHIPTIDNNAILKQTINYNNAAEERTAGRKGRINNDLTHSTSPCHEENELLLQNELYEIGSVESQEQPTGLLFQSTKELLLEDDDESSITTLHL